MKVTLERKDEDYLLEGSNASGLKVTIDNKTRTDVPVKGVSPMDLILMGVGGCSAIDIISILKKQKQEIKSYKVEVEGERKKEKGANPFSAIHSIVYLEGAIKPEKAKRAAALSFEKYCSVSITLEKSVQITYEVILNGKKI